MLSPELIEAIERYNPNRDGESRSLAALTRMNCIFGMLNEHHQLYVIALKCMAILVHIANRAKLGLNPHNAHKNCNDVRKV